MKRLGEIMRREPTDEEAEAAAHVVELALAWSRGALPLASVLRQCSGHDRWQAMRFADLGSEGKLALMNLVDAIVAADAVVMISDHGILPRDEFFSGYVKRVTDWAGDQVFVWPMFFMHDAPYYPRYDLEPGAKRREIEDAMRNEHRDYLRKKRELKTGLGRVAR